MNTKEERVQDLGLKAKRAADLLANVTGEQKNSALEELKKNLKIYSAELIEVNKKDIENARPSRFVKGDKLDAMITEIDRDKKTVTLSIKTLEEKQTKEAVKKY